MSTARPRLTDDLLRGALRWRAEGPDATGEILDDLLTVIGGTSQRRSWTFGFADAARPVVVLVALAGLLVATLGAAAFSGATPFSNRLLDVLQARAYIAPFHGWPPKGAVPSSPEIGNLVLNEVSIHPFRSAGVYADGRLIWDAEEAGTLDIGGWVEQRLTRDGVDLLRSHVVPLSAWPAPPASGLPASAWIDHELRAYVPGRYLMCYEFRVPGLQGSPSGWPSAAALDFLPKDLPELLRGSWAPRDSGDEPTTPQDSTCREVPTDTARSIERVVLHAGALADGTYYYTLQPPGVEPNVVLVTLFPLLPDGSPTIGFG